MVISSLPLISFISQFAHVLGSGRQPSTVQTERSAPKSSQWYADTADGQVGIPSGGTVRKELFVQEVKRAHKSFCK